MPTITANPGQALDLQAMGAVSGSVIECYPGEYTRLVLRPASPLYNVKVIAKNGGRVTVRNPAGPAADFAGMLSGIYLFGLDFIGVDRDRDRGIEIMGSQTAETVADGFTFDDCTASGFKVGLTADGIKTGTITRLQWLGGSISNCGAAGMFLNLVRSSLIDGIIGDQCGAGDPNVIGRPRSQTHFLYLTPSCCSCKIARSLISRAACNGLRGFGIAEDCLFLDTGYAAAGGHQSSVLRNCTAALFHDPDPANGITQGGGFSVGGAVAGVMEGNHVGAVRGCSGGHWSYRVKGDPDPHGVFPDGFRYSSMQVKSNTAVTEDGAFWMDAYGTGANLAANNRIVGRSNWAEFKYDDLGLWNRPPSNVKIDPALCVDPTRDPLRYCNEVLGLHLTTDAESVQAMVDRARVDRSVIAGLAGWLRGGAKSL